MIQEGYDKYRGGAFRIPGISKWTVVISGHKMVEELKKAPDEHVSFLEAAAESIQMVHTLGPEVYHDSYHIPVIRSTLTRHLVECFPDMQDELVTAFAEHLPPTEDWTSATVLPTAMQIVCRTSNRMFVGLPLCRNLDYRSINITFTIDVMKAAQMINLFPNILKPLAGRFFSNVPTTVKRAMRHLEPIILERLHQEEQYGKEWPGKPNDFLSWLIDLSEGNQRTPRELTMRVLATNFAAIHTTSMAFTQALLNLAAYPSHVPEMREEVEALIKEDGLTKVSLNKMRKIDSFIKESMRLGNGTAVSMQRKLLKDFTFSDGTFVPKGHTIAVANFATHRDEENYTDPNIFDGFRFSRMSDKENEAFNRHQAVALGLDYIVFGNGRHACPGRFFAVNELKALLVHVLLNYDVSLKEDTERPSDLWHSYRSAPDPKAAVMFRKRCA
ncbi:hypothetical protein H0H81_007716 [Sphagnurus paluster]|uniref:Cytochrome P450 n=1 Tax=Sphagnurus paluster TaxID=117069 RepID=A0A9P7GKI7_9AGAR|nr:hypothetical protein H0H81_007716 [Sphagnurus paluster]